VPPSSLFLPPFPTQQWRAWLGDCIPSSKLPFCFW
jgi:hypothetical protein